MGCCSSDSAPKAGPAPAQNTSKGDSGSHVSSGSRLEQHQKLRSTVEGGIGHGALCIDNPGDIHDCYNLDKIQLGEGAYGTVRKCVRKGKGSRAPRAVKQIQSAAITDMSVFEKEIAIMRIMDHPNICKLFESFQDKKYIYLVMELCEGGELFDAIVKAEHFTESQAAVVMQQTLRAMFYIHSMKICHRDLKCENFLLQTKDDVSKNQLKVIDFGLACHFETGVPIKTKCGSIYYAAPEIVTGRYNQLCDLWSCGCIMFVLLAGYPPFYGSDDAQTLKLAKKGNVVFKPEDWKNVSDDAKNLIRSLLKVNPEERFDAETALNHRWVKKQAPEAKSVNLSKDIVANMKSFNGQNKLKKAALHIISGQIGDDVITSLRETFTSLDENGDGLMTVEELKNGMKKAGLADMTNELVKIMEGIDVDGSGVIDYTEFLAAALQKKQYEEESVLWEAFQVFDTNRDGNISMSEMQTVLGQDNCKDAKGIKEMTDLIHGVGHCKEGGEWEINFKEFVAMMRGQGETKKPEPEEAVPAASPVAAKAAETPAEDTDAPGLECADAGTVAWAERVLKEQPLVIGEVAATKASALSPADINIDITVDQGGAEAELIVK